MLVENDCLTGKYADGATNLQFMVNAKLSQQSTLFLSNKGQQL